AGLLGERDGVVLADIAALGQRILRLVGAAAMLLDAEHAARLQRLEEGGEGLVGGAAGHPVVDVAEGDDEVGGARRRDVVVVAGRGDAGSWQAECRDRRHEADAQEGAAPHLLSPPAEVGMLTPPCWPSARWRCRASLAPGWR